MGIVIIIILHFKKGSNLVVATMNEVLGSIPNITRPWFHCSLIDLVRLLFSVPSNPVLASVQQ